MKIQAMFDFTSRFLEAAFTSSWAQGMGMLAAAIAVLTGMATSIGQGIISAKAMSAISRQPEAAGKIRTTMIIGQVMVETSAIYALIVAILILSKVPNVPVA